MAAGLIVQGGAKCPNDGATLTSATSTTTGVEPGSTSYTITCPTCGLQFTATVPTGSSAIAAANLHLAG